MIAAGGDAAATEKVLRVDDARSCEDLLLQLIGEVSCYYAPMCVLAVRITLPISSDSAEAVWSACICFCSCLGTFRPTGRG